MKLFHLGLIKDVGAKKGKKENSSTWSHHLERVNNNCLIA
jgi:hypothetical protein